MSNFAFESNVLQSKIFTLGSANQW